MQNDRWLQHDSLKQLWKMMRECWDANPSARLSALRIKKDLSNLLATELDGPGGSNSIKIV